MAISVTSLSALEVAVSWLREGVLYEPYGELTVSVTMKGGNIVCIKKNMEQVTFNT